MLLKNSLISLIDFVLKSSNTQRQLNLIVKCKSNSSRKRKTFEENFFLEAAEDLNCSHPLQAAAAKKSRVTFLGENSEVAKRLLMNPTKIRFNGS